MKRVFLCIVCLYTIGLTFEYEGLLFPAKHIVLSTLKSGVIIKLPFKDGQYVKKGTILLVQDPREDSLALILAEREKEKSTIQKIGEIEKNVALNLKIISYDNHFIRAPINGTIVKIMAKEHEYHSAGTKVIEIADLSDLLTEINVSKGKLNRVRKKGISIILSKGNQTTKGHFYAYNPLAEPGVELIMVKIIMKNKFNWFPGTYVKVRF